MMKIAKVNNMKQVIGFSIIGILIIGWVALGISILSAVYEDIAYFTRLFSAIIVFIIYTVFLMYITGYGDRAETWLYKCKLWITSKVNYFKSK